MKATALSLEESFARGLDDADPLASYRHEFEQPRDHAGKPLVYLVGNSLGLMPRAARALVDQELEDWARLGVDGHMQARTPWYSYHEVFRETGARLVGARPGEVVMMNSVTINLHLMLVTFYRPTAERSKVLVEDQAFPSDAYAVATHLAARGIDPASRIVTLRPRSGEAALRTEDIESVLQEQGPEIALVLLGGVNYYTGQLFELERIAQAAHRQGALVGYDLAHAAGNVALSLHDWEVDFAVWCSYKYLNAGPGAVGGCFVHQRHGRNTALPRFAGWWGNDPATRFEMRAQFVPREGADGWQVSNPPILGMAPLRASLELFDRAGMAALRAKSESLTGYLEALLLGIPESPIRILTPSDPAARGCQLSLHVPGGRWLHDRLRAGGIVTDYREPDVVRMAPVPLYNSYHQVWRTAQAVRSALAHG